MATELTKDFLVSTANCAYFVNNKLAFTGIANTDASLALSMQETEIKAGKMNKTQFILKHSRELTLEVKAANWDLAYIAAQTGSPIEQELTNVYRVAIPLVVASGTATLPDTPISDIHVETYTGDIITVTKPASGQVIDLTSKGITEGTIKVTYQYNKLSKIITVDTDAAPLVGTMILDVDRYDNNKGKIGTLQVEIPSLQLDGNTTISLTPDGVVSTDLTGKALAVAGVATAEGKEVYAYIKQFDSTDVAMTVTDIAAIPSKIALAVGGTAKIDVYGLKGGLSGNIKFSDGDCTFTSGTPATATVVADTGVVTGVAAGTSIITVTYGTFTDIVEVTVA